MNSESINLSFEVHCLTLIIIIIMILIMMVTMMMLCLANVFRFVLVFYQVSGSDGKEVPSQVNVWWDHRNRISTARYEVRIVIP